MYVHVVVARFATRRIFFGFSLYLHKGLIPNTHRYRLTLFVSFSCELVPDPDELLDHVLLADAQAGTFFHQLAQV